LRPEKCGKHRLPLRKANHNLGHLLPLAEGGQEASLYPTPLAFASGGGA